MAAAIEVARVSKAFRIPHEQRTFLKEYFLHPFRRPSYERNDALEGRHVLHRVGRVLRRDRAERRR